MTISPPEPEAKAKVTVDNDPTPTSFEKWAKPGHFRRDLSKGTKNHHLDLEPARRRSRL
jgi:photosystem I P700 chlorophyll a apoprotein A1